MANFNDFANKRILGVKALYLVGGFVVILAVVAWKLKPAKSPDATNADSGNGNGGLAPTGNPYDSLNPDGNGTVTVAQLGTNVPSGDTAGTPYTSEQWAKDGAAWTVKQGKSGLTPTQAYTALEKYLQGQDRSYEEQEVVDAWFKEKGAPPDAPEAGGKIAAPAGFKQITPPGYHTVKGPNDNTYAKLAKIYYGHDDPGTVSLIRGNNADKLGQIDGFSSGTKVFIPAFHLAKWYTLPSNMTRAQVAAKNGISEQQFIAMNGVNSARTSFKKGETLRVG